jgi:hypothetical protein
VGVDHHLHHEVVAEGDLVLRPHRRQGHVRTGPRIEVPAEGGKLRNPGGVGRKDHLQWVGRPRVELLKLKEAGNVVAVRVGQGDSLRLPGLPEQVGRDSIPGVEQQPKLLNEYPGAVERGGVGSDREAVGHEGLGDDFGMGGPRSSKLRVGFSELRA